MLWDQVQFYIQARPIAIQEKEFLETTGSLRLAHYGNPSAGTGQLPHNGHGCLPKKMRSYPGANLASLGSNPYQNPLSHSGPHRVDNGILLRSDIHKLFDTGYVTITPDYHFEVSRRIREDFENGRDYYAMNGRTLVLPLKKEFHPSSHFIECITTTLFLDK